MLRDLERESIRSFLEMYKGTIRGPVLDFGSGRQPYRALIETQGEYVPFDNPQFPGSVTLENHRLKDHKYNTVVCTQVLQYVPEPQLTVDVLFSLLSSKGWLLMTGPTNWPLVEKEDLWRFTPSGVRELLLRAGFSEITVESRAEVHYENEYWSLGWGARARR